jgi:hypothetical protein
MRAQPHKYAMLASLKKKNGIKLKYKVRNSKKTKLSNKKQKEPWDVRELCIRKTADLPLQLLVGTFPRFEAIRFYFLSETKQLWLRIPKGIR